MNELNFNICRKSFKLPELFTYHPNPCKSIHFTFSTGLIDLSGTRIAKFKNHLKKTSVLERKKTPSSMSYFLEFLENYYLLIVPEKRSSFCFFLVISHHSTFGLFGAFRFLRCLMLGWKSIIVRCFVIIAVSALFSEISLGFVLFFWY